MPRDVLFGEVDQWLGDIGIIGDETSVEIGKSKEGSDVFDFHWRRPFRNAVQFYWIHSKLSWLDNHA